MVEGVISGPPNLNPKPCFSQFVKAAIVGVVCMVAQLHVRHHDTPSLATPNLTV